MLFPSLPSRGTFSRRLEDDINNHSMPFKAKFYLWFIKLLIKWYLNQNPMEALLKYIASPY